MLKVEKIINHPVPSNCYVITCGIDNACIIVDPGTEDCKELLSLLKARNLYPQYIILTHEHIDHIIGIEKCLKQFNAKLICSILCNENINSLKYNLTGLSEKYEKKNTFPKANIIIDEIKFEFQWYNHTINFYLARGHSMGSMYFNIDNHLFIGDTLIKGHRTNTILPGASKEELIVTLEQIISIFNPYLTLVHSGHNDDFYLSEIVEDIQDQILFLNKRIKNKIISKNLTFDI